MKYDYPELENFNLLYVEDDLSSQEVISGIFENFFLKVFVAENGDEAFDIYKKENIDIIITDLEMPKINGISLITKIRNEDFHIPIIVFTAYTDKEHILPCANYNIQGYIEKPLNEDKINDIFKNLTTYLKDEKNNTVNLSNDIIYNIQNCELTKGNEKIILSRKEKMLLDLLFENKNDLVSYEKIEYSLWTEQDEVMSNTALRTLVKSLRQKTDKDIIKNISGMGYILKI